ncbi:MAG: Zn-dependent alcohol dehydrogenase [Solirubrobacterales bacterium]
METVNAALLRRHGDPLAIEEITLDDPAPGEVVVRTAAVGICHSDLFVLEGGREPGLPLLLGHEVAGIVERVGLGVDHVAPGDHVTGCSSAFCGRCEWCVRGRPNACVNKDYTRPAGEEPRIRDRDGAAVAQLVGLGAFTEKLLVSGTSLVKIPDAMPLDIAAMLGCAVTTGMGSVFNSAAVEIGDRVVVIGCGGVGLNAVQAAQMAGARQVIAVDMVPRKLELARRFGATDVVDASSEDAVAAVLALSGGGVDHAIEAVGTPATIQDAFAMLRFGGTATVIGIPPSTEISLPTDALLAEKRLQGSLMGTNRFYLDVPLYSELYMAGKLDLDTLLSERITLDQINEGLDHLRESDVERTVIVFDGVGEDGAAPPLQAGARS